LAVAASLAVAGMAFNTGAAQAQAAQDQQVQQARQAEQAADRAERQTDRALDRAQDRAENRRDAASVQAAAVKLPAGIQAKKADEINDVRKTLQTLTEAAFTKDGFDDAVERLVDQDRNRIGANNFAEKKFDDLNMKVDQFRQAWKAKYGRDFKINPEDAFAMTQVIQGEVQNPALVAGNWPVKATQASASASSDQAVTAGERATRVTQDPETGRATPRAGGPNEGTERVAKNEDANLEKGRDVAVATFPASHGLPAVNVSLVHEAGGWKVDAPNTLTGQQLHDNLLKHMTHVTEMSAQWPADVKQAEMAVSHHILAAVYGVDLKQSSSSSSNGAGANPNR
jgi:hypothetical protein